MSAEQEDRPKRAFERRAGGVAITVLGAVLLLPALWFLGQLVPPGCDRECAAAGVTIVYWMFIVPSWVLGVTVLAFGVTRLRGAPRWKTASWVAMYVPLPIFLAVQSIGDTVARSAGVVAFGLTLPLAAVLTMLAGIVAITWFAASRRYA